MKLLRQVGFTLMLSSGIAFAGHAQDTAHKHLYYPKHRAAPLTAQQPGFPGGPRALASFIKTNTHTPVLASNQGTEGNIEVEFDLAKDGTISNAHALNSLGLGCDEEAVRVVNSMPRWTPYVNGGAAKDTVLRVTIPFGNKN